MTDTTDIKALREIAFNANMAITRLSANSDDCLYAIGEDPQIDKDVELSNQFHKAFNPIVVIFLLDQLEAERQRAADLVLHVNTQENMRDKAEAELASVTKHRDEIERFRVAVCKDKDNLIDTCIARDREIAALKTKINKPVVPPRVEGLLKQWQFERDCEWKAAIEDAGGIVKDGE